MDMLFDYIIVSGGEPLLNDLPDLIADLQRIKGVTSKKIILYTTGLHHEKLKTLYEMRLIDGIHMDLKLPYHALDLDTDQEIILLALGRPLTQACLDALKASLHYTVAFDQGLNQIRSVKYPFLGEDAFEVMASYIFKLTTYYQKHVPYCINPFYDLSKQK